VTQQSGRSYSRLFTAIVLTVSFGLSGNAHAWGDEGHEIVGLIAEHYLDPAVKQKAETLLAGDTTHLTAGTDLGLIVNACCNNVSSAPLIVDQCTVETKVNF